MAQPLQSDPTAVFGRRFLAWLIDAALVLIPTFVLVTASFEYLDADQLTRSGQDFCDAFLDTEGGLCLDLTEVDDRVYFADGIDGPATLAYWGITIALLVVLQGLTGWTPGKLVTGIRTVGEDGRAPGLGRAFLRWILWIVDAFPYFVPLVGFITALTTVGHRRVGDMAAKTFVVRASAMGSPIVVPGLTAPPPGGPYATSGAWGMPVTTPPPPPGGGWGTPPAPAPPPSPAPSPPEHDAGWAAPEAEQPAAPAPSAAPPPQWDDARGTYIQWDPAQGAWLQWDEAAKAWTRIPGQ